MDPADTLDPAASVAVPPPPGAHSVRLARGALLQQGAQILRLGGGFVVVTVLAHRLSLSALGTYTILLSLITYVTFVKASVMNAAVVGVATAVGEGRPERLDVMVSTGLFIYLGIGVVSGLALAGIGLAVLPALHIPRGLHHAAQIGVIGLAAATMLSWPVQIFDDLLRGLQRFAGRQRPGDLRHARLHGRCAGDGLHRGPGLGAGHMERRDPAAHGAGLPAGAAGFGCVGPRQPDRG